MKRSTIIGVGALTAAIIAVPMAASAANGGAWLLGRSNAETATTTVTNTYGSPLSLNAKAGYAPLKVNSGTTVPNLSADKVDGYHASAFAMRTGKTATIVHDSTLDGVGAKCPAGTVFVSGGGFMPGSYDYIWYSGQDWDGATGNLIPNSWIVEGDAGFGVSTVTCYQPSGAAIPGAMTNISQINPATYAAAVASGRGAALSDTAVAKIGAMKELHSVQAPAAAAAK